MTAYEEIDTHLFNLLAITEFYQVGHTAAAINPSFPTFSSIFFIFWIWVEVPAVSLKDR